MESLTCARYTSSRQKLEGSCAAHPVVMVLLEQAVVDIVGIVVTVCVVRRCIVTQ
jgi:hypothetical protein